MRIQIISLLLVVSFISVQCTSTTTIKSIPNGAKIYIDGEPAGNTPYEHTDGKVVGSTTTVQLEKDGYQTYKTSFKKDEEPNVGAIVGGFFLWVPFLWALDYKPVHTYELKAADGTSVSSKSSTSGDANSKAARLRELKALLDEGIINQVEFDREKKKILAE